MSSVTSTPALVQEVPPTTRRSKWEILSAFGMLVGIYLRWTNLTKESFWFDEGLETWMISLTPGEIIRMCRADVAAPLHFITLRYWSFLFGNSEFALRAMSAFFASGSMIVLYLFVRRLLKNPFAVAIAVWLFALSTFQIQYAREARFYTMLCFLCLLALHCSLLYLTATKHPRLAITGVIVASVTSLYTHNAALFYFAALNVFWLILPADTPWKKRLRPLLLIDLCVTLGYLPWVPILLQQMRWTAEHFWIAKPTNWDLMYVLCFLSGGKPYALNSLLVSLQGPTDRNDHDIDVLVVCIAALVLLFALARRPRHALTLSAYFLLPVILVFVKSLVSLPIWGERLFITSSAFVPLLAALPFSAKLHWSLRILNLLILLPLLGVSLATIHAFDQYEHKEGWREAYNYINEQPRESTLVVFNACEGQLPFDYYLSQDRSQKSPFLRTGTPGGFFDIDPPQTLRKVDTDADLSSLKTLLASHEFSQVILVLSHDWWADPHELTLNYLDSTCDYADSRAFEGGIRVYRFSLRSR